jgi:hypothetical protein
MELLFRIVEDAAEAATGLVVIVPMDRGSV